MHRRSDMTLRPSGRRSPQEIDSHIGYSLTAFTRSFREVAFALVTEAKSRINHLSLRDVRGLHGRFLRTVVARATNGIATLIRESRCCLDAA